MSEIRKLSTSTILAILVISALFSMIPLGVVYGIAGGAPKLGVLHQTGPDSDPEPTSDHIGITYVNATAGNIGAKTDTGFSGNLTVFFTVGGSSIVTFSGAQFYLYLSKDGLSGTLSPGDVRYAGPFLVSSLALDLKGYPEANGTYYVGAFSGVGSDCVSECRVIEGPLPIRIASGFQFIKVFDGTSVAALQYLNISPGIRLNVNNGAGCTAFPSGPAWRPTCAQGGGFAPNTLIDLNYTYAFYSWPSSVNSTKKGVWESSVSTTANGWFNNTYPMIDTKQAVNPTSPPKNDKIIIQAVKHSHPATVLANVLPATPAWFWEYSRVFTQFVDYNQRGDLLFNDTSATQPTAHAYDYYGNATSFYGGHTGGTTTETIIDPAHLTECINGIGFPVFATGHLWVAGNWWVWGGTVSFWVSNGTTTGYNPLAPASVTAGATYKKPGSFGANLTIPTNLVLGKHTIKVLANGVYYTIPICMEPTLILTPHSGPASNPSTVVTVTAYGFPAKVKVFLYWNETVLGDDTEFNLANSTTGTNGQFNKTTTFVVPETYGGDHNVTAFNHGCSFFGLTFKNHTPPDNFADKWADCGVASATFTVTPSFVVIPGSFNATYGGSVKAIAEGLVPGVFYSVDIDNQQADFSTTFWAANQTQLLCGTAPSCAGSVTTFTSIITSGTSVSTSVGTSTSGGGGFTTISCTRSTGRVCHLKDPAGPAPLLINWLHGLVTPDGQGRMNLTFIGAGFRPGLHVVSITAADEWLSAGNYFPDAHALFTVTTQGDPIASMLASLTTTVNNMNTMLTTISNEVAAIPGDITTSTNTITSAISSQTTTLAGDISSSTSTITGAISSAQSAIAGDITSSTSSITTAVNDAKTSLSTQLNNVASDVTSIKSSVGGVSGLTNTANSILSAVQQEQTYVLVVAVLAAITLVLVLAVLIRRLS